LWHERVLVGFSPERISALCLGGLLRPRLLDRHAIPLQEQDLAQWDKGVDALEVLLAEPAWKGRDIDVILSGHYVRHVVVPSRRDLAAGEQHTLAKVVFRDTFGDLANDWELRVSPLATGRTTLACGVPRSLLAALRTVCNGRGRLRSVQSGLMPMFNQVRRQVGDSVGCLAWVEHGRITLAYFENGQWAYVDSRAGDGNSLPVRLLVEGELNKRQPGGILWLCDQTQAAHLPAGSFWSHKRVEPPRLPGFDGLSSLAIWGMV
jgi:hypothetical protein